MKISDLIFEGISPILYHRTSLNSLMKIFHNDKFRLTPDIGTDSESDIRLGRTKSRSIKNGDTVKIDNSSSKNTIGVVTDTSDDSYYTVKTPDGVEKDYPASYLSLTFDPKINKRRKKKVYYMSTARSKTGAYDSPSDYTQQQVTLVLDGKKLMNDGYTGGSINYWHGFSASPNEMEDRILSTNSHIDNFSKYIIEVHVLIRKGNDFEREFNYMAHRAKSWGEENNIPVFLYDEVKPYKLLNRKESSINLDNRTDSISFVNNKDIKEPFKKHIELLQNDDPTELSSEAKKELYDAKYPDYIRILKADVHNAKKGDGRNGLDEFIRELIKRKLYSLTDYHEYIIDKFIRK